MLLVVYCKTSDQYFLFLQSITQVAFKRAKLSENRHELVCLLNRKKKDLKICVRKKGLERKDFGAFDEIQNFLFFFH